MGAVVVFPSSRCFLLLLLLGYPIPFFDDLFSLSEGWNSGDAELSMACCMASFLRSAFWAGTRLLLPGSAWLEVVQNGWEWDGGMESFYSLTFLSHIFIPFLSCYGVPVVALCVVVCLHIDNG